MTEEHESDFLVTVRAQVMTRDESTEGWLPLAGGGLANVSIRKRPKLPSASNGHEYIIYGQRLSDQSVILSCVINRDLKYYKVMPTFHHWRAGKQRNGLTFQTAADARAFDKGILRAYSELIDGMTQTNCPTQTPALNKYDSVGEDDVFMALDLPVETENVQKCHSSPDRSENEQRYAKENDSIASKDNNNKDSKQLTAVPVTLNPLKTNAGNNLITTIASQISTTPPSTTSPSITIATSSNSSNTMTTTTTPTIAPSENYAYVTLTAIHDYNYPVVDQPVAAQILNASQDSISEVKKRNAMEAAQALAERSSPIARTAGEKVSSIGSLKAKQQQMAIEQQQPKTLNRCRYCHEYYNAEWNRKGSCEYAPDYCRSTVECISGLGCARCMLYHFMSDSEGETPQHPCECTNEPGCTKRWLGLTFLSFLVPCLWCYPPLRLCHMIGVRCGVCGGKHKPPV